MESFYEWSRCLDPGDDPRTARVTSFKLSLELAGLAVGVQNPIGSPLNRRSLSMSQCIVNVMGFLLQMMYIYVL